MEPTIEKIQETALTWPERATEIKIVNQESYNVAAQTLLTIANIEKKIKAHHEPIKIAAHNAHKAAVAAEKSFLDPLGKAKTIIKKAISVWEQEQARVQAEARRKAEEEARKKEEEERLAKAVEAEKQGKSEEEINKIIETPEPIKPVVVKSSFQRAEGVSTRESWKAEITDMKLLIEGIAGGKVSVEAVQPNMPFLNQKARQEKERFSIPGVKAVKDVGVVTR